MSAPKRGRNPWILRSDLRLALVTGLGAGFGLLNSVPFGYYVPLCTAAVLSGSYGNSMKLSIQRILGSVMGVLIVLLFSRGLQLPLPLGLGLALASVRLLGGALGLQVGYKVAGNIVIMGWLVHNAEETTWGMSRLFWTAFGIALSLWATRHIWPSGTIPSLHRQFARFIDELIQEFLLEQQRLEDITPSRIPIARRRDRRTELLQKINALRQQRDHAQVELGLNPENHQLHQLWTELDLLISQLMSVLDGLRGLPAPVQSPPFIKALHLQEAEVLSHQIALLTVLAGNLRRTDLVEKQCLDLQSLQEPNRDLEAAAQQLTASLEAHAGPAGREEDIAPERMRQIVLRSSLIEHGASVLHDCLPGMARSKPVTATR
tara:strand:+ start:321 stop:1448 length:1128 start_codon:yes stop_codon:yes gene_type:complete